MENGYAFILFFLPNIIRHQRSFFLLSMEDEGDTKIKTKVSKQASGEERKRQYKRAQKSRTHSLNSLKS